VNSLATQLPLLDESEAAASETETTVETFAADLPYLRAPFAKRNWGHRLHSICSYQGKFKPALAHWLVRAFTKNTDVVLDPLGGAGTVALEAALQGRRSITNDINPLAHAIASAKVSPTKASQLDGALDRLWKEVESVTLDPADLTSASFGLNSPVADYYHPRTLEEVLRVRKVFLRKHGLSQEEVFLRACMLHILHGNRPYALSRRSHPLTPFAPQGDFVYRSVRQKIRERYQRLLEAGPLPQRFVPGTSYNEDFRRLPALLSGHIDVVITSPPFIGLRYDRPNWLRLWFCGWGERDFHQTSLKFLEREQTRSPTVYKEFFGVCDQLLAPSGVIVMHLGGSHKYDMKTNMIACSQEHFTLTDTVVEDVAHMERHGVSDKGQTTVNYLLFFCRKR
jgi:hypothetical protein